MHGSKQNAGQARHELTQVPPLQWAGKMEDFCAAYQNSSAPNITACFCVKDDCNSDTFAQGLLGSDPSKTLSITKVNTWTAVHDADHTKKLFECFKINLQQSAGTTGGNGASPDASQGTGTVTAAEVTTEAPFNLQNVNETVGKHIPEEARGFWYK
ncbi:hypothetical protein COOONC_15444 [Cooperia oncophora]